MKHVLRCGRSIRQHSLLGVLGLCTATTALHAQTTPSTLYALGNVTQPVTAAGVTYNAGDQLLNNINPSTLQLSTLPLKITGVSADQQLIGLDVRPSTGQLFGLGYNASAGTARLYTINVTTGIATAVGAADIPLNLRDTNASNTRGLTTNVGFDFNPRVDRIRVVAPNGTNYRLNPITGGLAATDGNLFYVANPAVPTPAAPYIGTGAYTNSQVGVRGTTLYDIDLTTINAVYSTQMPPNNGQLNPQGKVTFAVNGSTTYTDLASPTVRLDLDVYYDNTTSPGTNTAYLLEARYSDPANTSPASGFASNLYRLNLSTGQATGLNVFGRSPIYLADIAAAIVPPPITWTGAAGPAWNVGANWSTGTVPGAGDNVFIPGTAASQPTVSAPQAANTVTLGIGAVLTVADGTTLSVNGDFVNNDSRVAGPGTIALSGSAAQDIGGNATTTFSNLSVGAAGATTSGPVAIQRSLTLAGAGNLALGSGQAFTLLSSASGTAAVLNQGTGLVTGLATVQRAINNSLNGGLGYRHYSSPVTRNSAAATSGTVADLATPGFSPVVNPDYNTSATPSRVSPFPTVFGYDQSRLGLANSSPEFDRGFFSPAALTDGLTTGRGYAVNIGAAEVVDFQGTLNSGDVALGSLTRGSQPNAGWHLLGNPYPSAIDYNVVYTNSTGLENALYVVKSSGQYTGGYASFVNGFGVNGGSVIVPLGQGFFVRVASAQAPGSLTFTNAARTTAPETSPFQRLTNTSPVVALTLSGAGVANQTRVYFEQGATPAFDARYDAHYLPASHGLELASELSTEALAINGLPELSGPVTVPLRLHAATAGTYALRVDELANLPAGYRAYLRDAQTGALTDLATTASLSLPLAPTDAATGRFSIVLSTNATLAAAPAALAALVAVYPNPAHGTATLVLPTTLRGQATSQVEILNALGQAVLRRTVAAGGADQVALPLGGLAAGIYTVRATTAGGAVARQLRVE